jgi:hypothetical protein
MLEIAKLIGSTILSAFEDSAIDSAIAVVLKP